MSVDVIRPAAGVFRGDPHYLLLLDELRSLHRVKSQGYGTAADALANFAAVAELTGEPAWRYPRRRAVEKLARLESLETQARLTELRTEYVDVASLCLCGAALLDRVPTELLARDPGRFLGGPGR